MPRLNFTCKGCESRYPGCHDTCEKYKQERAEYDRVKHIEDLDRRVNDYIARGAAYASDQSSRCDRFGLKRKSGGFKK